MYYKNWEAYNLCEISTLVTWFHLTQALKNEKLAAQASQTPILTFVGQTHQGGATEFLWG